jgi:protein TonB
MFDYGTGTATPHRAGSRLVTGVVSAIAHIVVLVAVAIPALYATDVLPEPPDMMAFVVNVAPPPPPPPPSPPPRAEVPKKPDVTPRPARSRTPAPEPPKARPAAAPVEAPDGIREETGLESTLGAIDDLAGFEYGVEGGLPGGVIGGISTMALAPPPPPPPPPTPVRVGGHITPPRLTHRVEPEYPLLAQHAQIQGIVIIEATVDERGRVTDVNALRAHPALRHAAVDAVRQWRYQPLVLNGIATPFVLTVTVSFSLAEG